MLALCLLLAGPPLLHGEDALGCQAAVRHLHQLELDLGAGREPLEAARERHLAARAELPQSALKMSKGEPALPTILLDEAGGPADNPYAKEPERTEEVR